MKSNTINMKIKPTTLIRVDNNDNHYEQHKAHVKRVPLAGYKNIFS